MATSGQCQHFADGHQPDLRRQLRNVDIVADHAGKSADQLRELVLGVRILYLGRRFPAERSRMGIRSGGWEQSAGIPVGFHGSRDDQSLRDLWRRNRVLLPERRRVHGGGQYRARGDCDAWIGAVGATRSRRRSMGMEHRLVQPRHRLRELRQFYRSILPDNPRGRIPLRPFLLGPLVPEWRRPLVPSQRCGVPLRQDSLIGRMRPSRVRATVPIWSAPAPRTKRRAPFVCAHARTNSALESVAFPGVR